jgi:hypothetical protein
MHQGLPVLFRITTSAGETGTLLRLDGRLSADGTRELERVCRDLERPLTLDLSELRSADGSGLAAIRELVARGAELVDVPKYIALLLGQTF